MWYKDTPAAMDDYQLEDAAFIAKEYRVVSEKVSITQNLDPAEYPPGSRNEGLRKRHDLVEDGDKILICFNKRNSFPTEWTFV